MSTRLTKLVDYGLIIATIIFAIYTVTLGGPIMGVL